MWTSEEWSEFVWGPGLTKHSIYTISDIVIELTETSQRIAVIVSIVAISDIAKSKRTSPPTLGMGRAIFGLLAGLFACFLLSLLIGAQLL